MNKNSLFEENLLNNKFLLENIQGGIVYSDFEPPFHLRYCTEGMAKLAGYTPEELVQLTQIDIVVDEDLPALIEDVNRQFACGDTFEVEYRLKRKDGSFVHVLDRAKVVLHDDGKKYIHCLLTDISELKEMEHKLQLNQKKYQIAIEQSGKVIMEYNFKDEQIHFSDNYEQLFGGTKPAGTHFDIINSDWVLSEYKDDLAKLINEVLKTYKTCKMEIKIKNSFNTEIWCSLDLIPVTNNNQIYSIIGCLENIDLEKKNIDRLTALSEIDGLTGVYNRYTVEKLIESKMFNVSNKISVLFILDVDYFKQINDLNGHAFGDQILIDLSKYLKNIVPQDAVLGRLGGDEFLIFLQLEDNEKLLNKLAENVVCGVREYFEKDNKKITISVGVSWTSIKDDIFQNLYRNADKALYRAKSEGRNCYNIF